LSFEPGEIVAPGGTTEIRSVKPFSNRISGK
jgi:hypothetical protein